MKRYVLPAALAALALAFWLRAEVQEIAAGVAIFLFGMLMLEDGFRIFSGGLLERLLARATGSLPRALALGVAATTLLQSSSLVSIVTISFLSAGLMSLAGGIGVILGANIGTTTGAWLVAGFGLKVNIAAYAMPMLAIGIILVFQKSPTLRGIGYALGGLGFLFLGIHHMKEGFDAFKDHIDLTRFALGGLAGLIAYTLIGTAATVVMQSSHATMVLVITALFAGQITYENALALAIGANIGTTVTAVVGSLGANFQGKRLALAHVIFNLGTAAIALVFIAPLAQLVDGLSAAAGIAGGDYALKLAVFHTIFNVLGVVLTLPLLGRLVGFLERRIVEPAPAVSMPLYLNDAVEAFPEALETALRNEVGHLYENAEELVLHGLNLHRHEVFAGGRIEDAVHRSRTPFDLDLGERYEQRIKMLYGAIVDYASRAGARGYEPETARRIFALRDAASGIVQAIKSVKHLRKNILRYTTHPRGAASAVYNELRIELAWIMAEIHKLGAADPAERSTLWLDQASAQIEDSARSTTQWVDALIRTRNLTPGAATSFLNDSAYAHDAMRELLAAARILYATRDSAVAEVEQLLALDEDELERMVRTQSISPPITPSGPQSESVSQSRNADVTNGT